MLSGPVCGGRSGDNTTDTNACLTAPGHSSQDDEQTSRVKKL